MLVLAIFCHPLFRRSIMEPLVVAGDARNSLRLAGFGIDLALVCLVLFIQVWTIWDIDAFHMRYGEKDLPDLIVGGILIALVLEATRRAVGSTSRCGSPASISAQRVRWPARRSRSPASRGPTGR